MKIVVLDGQTLNPGDLDWGPLERLGNCRVYPRTQPAEVVDRSAGADALLTNKTRITAGHIAALPQLRYIGVLATGYDVVDAAAAGRRGIPVTNVPDYGTPSVAQAAFALLLELTNDVGALGHSVRQGRWSASPDFCYWDRPLLELAGLTLGIVGLGRIGQAVARIAQAFGMSVIACSLDRPEAPGVRFVEMDDLFAAADVVSLHCPLTEATAGLVDARRLGLMKRSALLINTARGGLVDQAALAKALRAGRIAGAGLDVLAAEPPPAENPLLAAPNCVITPHVAWATAAARRRLMATAVANLEAFIEGRPRNVVNEQRA